MSYMEKIWAADAAIEGNYTKTVEENTPCDVFDFMATA